MKKTLLSAAVIWALLLCGCGKNSPGLPEDTPYNHGPNAIMETENGYYTNTPSPDGGHMLRFYERDSEKQIFLCAKPECIHDGNEGCAATYKDLKCINTLLYDGAIYTLAIEDGDVISYSLYKAALDGTSFTKIGDAFSVSNSAGESYETMGGMYFMIHKGYAYIPYHIMLGDSTFGFAGSGLVKMDIVTGKTETLASGENYFSAFPHGTAVGSGNNVYYYLSTSRHDDPNTGTYRYNTVTGETEKIADYTIIQTAVGERYFYAVGAEEDSSMCIMKLDINADINSVDWEILGGSFENYPKIFAYKDKAIAVSDKDGVIMIFDENKGETGKISFDPNEISGYDEDIEKEFYISADKVYMSIDHFDFDEDYDVKIYSIPISDIEEGKDEWKFEYGIKNPWQLFYETGRDIHDVNYD